MESNKKKKIILSVDSSSSVSGVALFVNKELKEYTEIIHNEAKTQPKEWIDLQQNRMQDVIDKLLFKYLQDVDNVEEFVILIEQPKGSYTNNKTYGRLMFYAGLWLGKITGLVSAIPTIMEKTKYASIAGGAIAKYFKFDKELVKIQAIEKVKELYDIDLFNLKLPKYNQDGTIKRTKKTEEVIYQLGPKHNAADAILLGYLYLNNKIN